MPDFVVETSEGLTLRYELAGAGTRSAAALLDFGLWLSVTLTVLFVLLFGLGGAQGLYMWILTGTIVSLCSYQVLFAVFWNGRTPGKWVMGIRSVDASGAPAGSVQHLLRGLFWPVECLLVLVPVPLAILLVAMTPRRQRLGDMVAGTVVLRDPRPRGPDEPFRRDDWTRLPKRRLELVPAHAARFGGEDLDFLRELLGRVGLRRDDRARLLVKSAHYYAPRIDLDLAPDAKAPEAREILRELYLFLREMRSRQTSSRPAAAARG